MNTYIFLALISFVLLVLWFYDELLPLLQQQITFMRIRWLGPSGLVPPSRSSQSCISIMAPGGFKQLRHIGIETGTVGANMKGYKPTLLQPGFNKQEDQVLLEVYAFGVNYADICIRWGLYSSANEFVGFPITPGFEVSGKVVWAGSSSGHSIGDLVYGFTMFGGYSTQVLIPGNQVFAIPYDLDPINAAAIPTCAATAWYALRYLARPSEGARVLVHSAAGGVGTNLVQMAKAINLHVTGVVGAPHKVKILRDLGCDVVIDKSSSGLWKTCERTSPEGYHVVFDANGLSTLEASFEHLRATGILVTYGMHSMLPSTGSISPLNWIKLAWGMFRTKTFTINELITDNKSVMGFNLSYLFGRSDLVKLFQSECEQWLSNGSLKVARMTKFRMEHIQEAHAFIQSRKSIGKIVMVTPKGEKLCDDSFSRFIDGQLS